jgi:hypothetical protein
MFHLHCFTNYSFIPSPSLLGCSDPRASTLRQRCQVWSLLGCSYPRAGHLDERLGEQGEGERLGWASGDQAAAGRGSEQQRQAGSGWASRAIGLLPAWRFPCRCWDATGATAQAAPVADLPLLMFGESFCCLSTVHVLTGVAWPRG